MSVYLWCCALHFTPLWKGTVFSEDKLPWSFGPLGNCCCEMMWLAIIESHPNSSGWYRIRANNVFVLLQLNFFSRLWSAKFKNNSVTHLCAFTESLHLWFHLRQSPRNSAGLWEDFGIVATVCIVTASIIWCTHWPQNTFSLYALDGKEAVVKWWMHFSEHHSPDSPKGLLSLSDNDVSVAITFGKSRRDNNMIKSFYSIHVCGEPNRKSASLARGSLKWTLSMGLL